MNRRHWDAFQHRLFQAGAAHAGIAPQPVRIIDFYAKLPYTDTTMPSNNAELEKDLWDAADELRANSRLRAADYSIPVLGLIFLK